MRLTELDVLIRLGLGFLAGAVIGVERSSRHQIAGLRTHILIATGATLLMLLSIWIPQEYQGMKNGDPGRIAAQVVSGIGFLGAGAIIRLGNNIKGLTTAASLWLVAAVGLAIGAGMFLAAGGALVITLITLVVLASFEKRFFPTERNKVLEITFTSNNPNTQETLGIVRSFGVRILSMDVDQGPRKGKEKDRGTRMRLFVGVSDHIDGALLVRALKTSDTVERVEMKEKFF
ncbi:MAG: MgtC/SapB family protein [Spirochaetaceae bacterium]|jgi:putative Mg2+ transporter-C (MgtC) family protein|nr:MgtC/SapB family protein [Spirochaetaceae bacterium]